MVRNELLGELKPRPNTPPALRTEKYRIRRIIWSAIIIGLFVPSVWISAFSINASALEWQTAVRLTEDPVLVDDMMLFPEEGMDTGFGPQVVVDNSEVHVVWTCIDSNHRYPKICYKFYNGSEWQPVYKIGGEGPTYSGFWPALAVENGEVHIVWQNLRTIDGDTTAVEIYYKNYNGTSWQTLEKLASLEGNLTYGFPSMAVENGKVYVVWNVLDSESQLPDIYYTHFNGTVWETEHEPIVTNANLPTIAVDDGKAYVAFTKDSDLYYTYKDGDRWHAKELIGDEGSIYSFAVEDGKIYVTWISLDTVDQGCILDNDYDIKFRYHDGEEWKPEERITSASGVEVHHGGALVVEDGKAYLAWMELNLSWARQYTPGCEYSTLPINRNATYYSYFDGEEWSDPEEITSGDDHKSRLYPSIAVENGIVYAVWMEEADEDWEFHIYFSRVIPPDQPLPILGIAAAGTIAIAGMVAAGVIAGTDIGKYSFLSFFIVPLYTRLKRNEILDNFVRGQIYQYIRLNPGDHYNSIKEKVGINNGTCAYHLHVLQREGFIKSVKEGRYMRFFPLGVQVPQERGIQLSELQKKIISVISNNPGITQTKIANSLKENRQTINYNVTQLERISVLRIEKSGRETYCYLA